MQIEIGESLAGGDVHRWAEAIVHAERAATDEEYTRAYTLAPSARRAMGQLRRHGWTVTYQTMPPCTCGLPNRYH